MVAISSQELPLHHLHVHFYPHRRDSNICTRKQPTSFLSIPSELRQEIFLLAIDNFAKDPKSSLPWLCLSRPESGSRVLDWLAQEFVDVAITRRLAFYIWGNCLILAHTDIEGDLVYAFTKFLNCETEEFDKRCNHWHKWEKTWRKETGRKVKVPRFTFTRARSMLWYNFTKMQQVELGALVEKKQIPNLIDDVLESFGFVEKRRRRGRHTRLQSSIS